jgi:DNA gyrase subunit A
VITEIPFQVNKARLIEHIAGLVKEKKIEGISDIRDESDKEGLRVVIDLKKGIIPGIILNQLYKHTALESTFGIINLAIVDNQPRYLPLRELIDLFVLHRIEIIRRRSEFDRKKAEERVHILKGLLLALSRIDEVIAAIRASDTAETAKNALIARFGLDEVQAQAILQMQLRRLAALEQQKILDERNELEQAIALLSELLSEERNIRAEIRRELIAAKEKYGDSRRTQISASVLSIDREDMIEDKKVLVSLTSLNYIKRMDIDTYRQQRRGGKGIIGMSTKEEDYVENVFIANTHDYLLCFTSNGRVYWLKVYEIPESSRTSRGKAIVNLLNLRDEAVTTVIPVREFSHDRFLQFVTRLGQIIKIPLKEFSFPRSVGTNAIRLRENDQLVDVIMTDGNKEIILTSSFGQSLRFHENTVRTVGRNAQGVRGMKMRGGDTVVAITLLEKDRLLTISDAGFGKRTEFDDFRGHGRGTMGVRNIQLERNAVVIASCAVADTDEIIVMTASGIVMRTAVSEIRIIGRGTKGVRIMRLDEHDRVVGIAVVPPDIDNGDSGEPETGEPGEAERGQPGNG